VVTSPQNSLIDERTDVQAALLGCYLATVETIAESMAVICPEIANPYKARVLRLRQGLICESTPKELDESDNAIRAELRGFSEGVGQYLRQAIQTATLINDLALDSFTAIREQTEAQCQLTQIAWDQIATSCDLDDSAAFRTMLQQRIIGLRAKSGRMQRDNAELLDHLTKEIRAFQVKVQDPTSFASAKEVAGERLDNLCEEPLGTV
jgi:hypothetical protein